jgi:DNA (cytosine-5)-methyltransferase 1
LLRLIDVFSGAGGMTLGFSRAFNHRFRPVLAIDSDQAAIDSYNTNFGRHGIAADIVELLKDEAFRIPRAEVVIGGPPCQGFSLLNRSRRTDARKSLWRPFLTVVERSEAEVFVMENVPQLLKSAEYRAFHRAATRMGYQLHADNLCAADYGVPQVRWRAFVVGSRVFNPKEFFPPQTTHVGPRVQLSLGLGGQTNGNYPKATWQSVRDAIADLPKPSGVQMRVGEPTLDLHFGRKPTPVSLQRYKAIPKEGMNRFDLLRAAPELTPPCWIRKTSGGSDLFGRLWWDRPAPTIRTQFWKPEKGRYLHPKQHRSITHREAARLQSFPDTFRFCGTKIEVGRQIGNAVPPLLASAVASSVERMFGWKTHA